MEIAIEAFSRRRRSIILRTVLMGFCSATCTVLAYIYSDSELINGGFFSVTCTLLIVVIWVATTKTPANRTAQLHPTIKIPAPLILRGLDTASEPIQYWLHQKKFSEHVVLTTRTRMVSISRSWFTDSQWQQLLENLPSNKPLNEGATREGIRICFVVFFTVCAALHLFGNPFEIYDAANRLAMGAYNPALATSGEVYRALSYSFLHLNDSHIIANGFGFFIITSALRESYSNFSLTALMGSTAILSVIVGTQLSVFEVVVGASGIVMGVTGFLITAQYMNDSRLHPLHRVTQHKYLYFYLIFEITISLIYKSYGGMVHITAFLVGSGYYLLFEKEALTDATRVSRRKYQWATNLVVLALTLQWSISTYNNYRSPYEFVDRIMRTDDIVLTMVGAQATPDNPNATEERVLTAKARALANEGIVEYNSIAVARADHWLGNNEAALARIRKTSIELPDDDLVISLWLAIEQANLGTTRELLPDNHLPAGTGAAYIVTEQGDYLARFNLRDQPQNLSSKIKRPAYRNWHLIELTDALPRDAQGIWRLKPNQFRTRNSAASAKP